jgi:UDP-2-acetamido-3-amino-2,3-dideoxy-glucuronate N-acetyltransferase
VISCDVILGDGVSIPHPNLVNLYGCRVGDGTKVGAFVEIQRGVDIGRNCKISSHSFLCTGVTIEDGVFIGHGVMFINDLFPQAVNTEGSMQTNVDWALVPTLIKSGSAIGSNATILGGLTIGAHALIGAGTVVVRDVPDYAVVVGSPGRIIGDTRNARYGYLQSVTAEAMSGLV